MKKTAFFLFVLCCIFHVLPTHAQENDIVKRSDLWRNPDKYLPTQAVRMFGLINQAMNEFTPTIGESTERKLALYLFDAMLHETKYDDSEALFQFADARMEHLMEILKQPAKKGLYIYKVYKVSSDAEVTLEVNPDDVRDEYTSALRSSLPICRLSMGVQTFNDERLRFLKRRHTAAQAFESVDCCRRYGFTNLSIDLIYGLPGETLDEWEHDLRQALSLEVPHLSAYHLSYEEGTPLWKMKEQGRVTEVDEEVSAAMYTMLVEHLVRAGYEHYEISNFCSPGMESRHNSSYWKGIPYIGCGAAAHSFDGKSRQWNIASIPYYINGVNEGTRSIEL